MPPVPVGVQRLAAQLALRMPWLVRGRHIGALARLLHRHRLSADDGWSAERLLQQLEQHLRGTGSVVPEPAQQRNPLGYLHTLLIASSLAQQLDAQPKRSCGPAPWQVEADRRRRELAAEDPALRAAAIARLRADMRADAQRHTNPIRGSRQRNE